jgi:hypothetical protein
MDVTETASPSPTSCCRLWEPKLPPVSTFAWMVRGPAGVATVTRRRAPMAERLARVPSRRMVVDLPVAPGFRKRTFG